MGIYATIGMAWLILTSSLATFAILYLSYIGLRVSFRNRLSYTRETDTGPVTSQFKTIPLSWSDYKNN